MKLLKIFLLTNLISKGYDIKDYLKEKFSKNKLNVTTLTATVNQYGDYIQLSDVLELTAIDNNVVQATKLLGSQAGRTLDTITREVLAGGTNVMYAGEKTSRATLTADDKLTPDLLFKAKAQLAAMNAEPIDDCYVAIVHPYVAYDLMRNEEWIDSHKYATPENIYKGERGFFLFLFFCPVN